MNDLINVVENDEGNLVVDARELHGKLMVETQFSLWIERRIEKYGFVEGKDYKKNYSKLNITKPSTDYSLTISCAKEIAMVENNEMGRQIRLYLIGIEEKSKDLFKDPIIKLRLQQMDQERRLKEVESEIRQISYRAEDGYMTCKGYLISNGINLPNKEISNFGKACSKFCRDNDIAISNVPDEKWCKVNTYPFNVLDEVYKGK